MNAYVSLQVMANLARLFDPSLHHSRENGEIFVFSFLQPTKQRKISYAEQQELLRISLEEHPEFNKQGMILDTIEKGGKKRHKCLKKICSNIPFISVCYPVIHVLRITEEAEKDNKKDKLSNATKVTMTVNLAKPLSLLEPKSVAFVEASNDDAGCEAIRPVQLASIKLHKSTDLGPDVYLMQGSRLRQETTLICMFVMTSGLFIFRRNFPRATPHRARLCLVTPC